MSDISDEDLEKLARAIQDAEHFRNEKTRISDAHWDNYWSMLWLREIYLAKARAAIEALQALGWLKVEKKSKSNDLSLGEILYGWDSKPFPPTSKPEGKV